MKAHAQKPSQSPDPTAPHLAGKRPNPQTAGHVVHPIMALQRAIGDQESERSLPGNAEAVAVDSDPSEAAPFGHDFSRIPVFSKTPVRIQTKLTVNAPGDIYEQEADRVAEEVMSMSDSVTQLPAQRQLQSEPAGAPGTGQTQAPAAVGNLLRSPGHPLDFSTRAFMERRFGHDFGQRKNSCRFSGSRGGTSGASQGFHGGFEDRVRCRASGRPIAAAGEDCLRMS